MQVGIDKISEYFNGTKQLVVPIFQRRYAWEKENWARIWEDVKEQYEQYSDDKGQVKRSPHFTGAVVTAPSPSLHTRLQTSLLIDGQQRITTFAIILCAVREFFPEYSDTYNDITSLLLNSNKKGDESYTVLPTRNDREGFFGLLRRKSRETREEKSSRFSVAFNFFKQAISKMQKEYDDFNIENLFDVISNNFVVVTIQLDEQDNPYLIFETLNGTGADLKETDLVRNYLLMQYENLKEQKEAHENLWLPVENTFSSPEVSNALRNFVWTYLRMEGDAINQTDIYSMLKKKAEDADSARQQMERMKETSILYAKIIYEKCSYELPTDIVDNLNFFRKWKVGVSDPFILRLLDVRERGGISDEDVSLCLRYVESFVVRREVCNVPTNQLKRIFLQATGDLYKKRDAPEEGVPLWLAKFLMSGEHGARWPGDEEYTDSWHRYRAYSGSGNARCKLILKRLENSFEHKETVNTKDAEIEHVMPQTLTDEWREMLGEEAREIHERRLHTFGNLTLSAYNSNMKNAPFDKKSEYLKNSHFEMNKDIVENERWGESEIHLRSESLVKRAKRIWLKPLLFVASEEASTYQRKHY